MPSLLLPQPCVCLDFVGGASCYKLGGTSETRQYQRKSFSFKDTLPPQNKKLGLNVGLNFTKSISS